MDGWYYKLFDVEFGPESMEKLVELIKDRSLSRTDEVRFGEKGNWRRIGSIGPLMAHLPFESGERLDFSAAEKNSSVPNRTSVATGPLPNSRGLGTDFAGATFALDRKPTVGTNGNDFSEILDAAEVARSPENDGRWWCSLQGKEYGPFDLPDLVELVKDRRLSSNDEVRFGPNGNWRRVGSIGPLMAHLPFEAAEKTISDRKAQLRSIPQPSPVANGSTLQTEDIDFANSVNVSEPSTAEKEVFANVTDSGKTSQSGKSPEAGIRWWCIIQGKEYGPVELSKLVEWAETGRMRRDDHIRCGLEPYVVAGELPGLFPELPKSAAFETKSDTSTRSETVTMPVWKHKLTESAAASPNNAAERPAISPSERPAVSSHASETSIPSSAAPTPQVSTPKFSPSTPMGGGISANKKAPVPVRPPAKKSSGGGSLAALLPIGLGVGGVLLVGALIYVAILFMPASTVEEIRRLKVLQDGYSSMIKLRDASGKPSDEDLKSAKEKILAATKTVLAELKKIENKNPNQTSLNKLARAMDKVAKEEGFSEQKSKNEMDVSTQMGALEKALGLKS